MRTGHLYKTKFFTWLFESNKILLSKTYGHQKNVICLALKEQYADRPKLLLINGQKLYYVEGDDCFDKNFECIG